MDLLEAGQFGCRSALCSGNGAVQEFDGLRL